MRLSSDFGRSTNLVSVPRSEKIIEEIFFELSVCHVISIRLDLIFIYV
jgi:hypothetical protein